MARSIAEQLPKPACPWTFPAQNLARPSLPDCPTLRGPLVIPFLRPRRRFRFRFRACARVAPSPRAGLTSLKARSASVSSPSAGVSLRIQAVGAMALRHASRSIAVPALWRASVPRVPPPMRVLLCRVKPPPLCAAAQPVLCRRPSSLASPLSFFFSSAAQLSFPAQLPAVAFFLPLSLCLLLPPRVATEQDSARVRARVQLRAAVLLRVAHAKVGTRTPIKPEPRCLSDLLPCLPPCFQLRAEPPPPPSIRCVGTSPDQIGSSTSFETPRRIQLAMDLAAVKVEAGAATPLNPVATVDLRLGEHLCKFPSFSSSPRTPNRRRAVRPSRSSAMARRQPQPPAVSRLEPPKRIPRFPLSLPSQARRETEHSSPAFTRRRRSSGRAPPSPATQSSDLTLTARSKSDGPDRTRVESTQRAPKERLTRAHLECAYAREGWAAPHLLPAMGHLRSSASHASGPNHLVAGSLHIPPESLGDAARPTAATSCARLMRLPSVPDELPSTRWEPTVASLGHEVSHSQTCRTPTL
nr:unnamed protein product [Digitaria exilis]